MPELPEVETVRRGLETWVVGRRISAVQVWHPRAIRRHLAGADDFVAVLTGRTVVGAHRRGKFLWLPLDSGDALIGHLGMSGQLLLRAPDAPDETHLRVRIAFDDGQEQLRFVDQRTFGGLSVSAGGAEPPPEVAHIARDPLDPQFDEASFVSSLRKRRVGIKTALLDQSLISGVGNIYADEALWRARLHGARQCDALTRPAVRELLAHVREVLTDSIRSGGTSFDALYVNVNGESGSSQENLNVYGRQGLPCKRCGTPIVRERFMNRSSHFCPVCQRKR